MMKLKIATILGEKAQFSEYKCSVVMKDFNISMLVIVLFPFRVWCSASLIRLRNPRSMNVVRDFRLCLKGAHMLSPYSSCSRNIEKGEASEQV